jgi:hypothetical protein
MDEEATGETVIPLGIAITDRKGMANSVIYML